MGDDVICDIDLGGDIMDGLGDFDLGVEVIIDLGGDVMDDDAATILILAMLWT